MNRRGTDSPRPARRFRRRGLLLAVQILALGGGLSAQSVAPGTVLGRVLDQESREPLEGAFVSLLDPQGVRQAAVLTDEAGRYVLRVQEPGNYRLRAERIGAESAVTELLSVSAGQVLVRDLITRASAVTLEGIEVTGESRCDLRGATASSTVRLWEEARKALEVAEWVDDVGYLYDTRSFERILQADGGRVIREDSQRSLQAGRAAFRSLDAERLLSDGFIQDDGDGQLYYAPDAAVLLSDDFLATHCFRTVREDGVLGLAFEPAPGRAASDIEGTLWFGEGGALDYLDFRYTGLPTGLRGSSQLGGEIHFFRLAEGAWIVREWRIRMPRRTEVTEIRGSTPRLRLMEIQEVGGEVRSARRAERVEAVFDARRGAVRGTALGPGGSVPMSGARLFLSGTGYSAVTAEDGTFFLANVRPGLYDLVMDHPSLRSLGSPPRGVSVEVMADSVVVASLALPDRETLLGGRCEGQPLLELSEPDFREDGAPAIAGGVVLDDQGVPVPGWPVRVQWVRPSLEAGSVVREARRGTVIFTDAYGGWAACGLPADVAITAEASRDALTPEQASAGRGRWGAATRLGLLGPGARRWVELQASR